MKETAAGELPDRFDVAAFIDARPVGWREITLLAVCALVLFIDGFDMYFLGKIAPAVAEGLGGRPVDMTEVFTLQQVGMALGAFVMPPLADRIGRKPVLALCLSVFGALSLWAIFAPSLHALAWLRGVSGVFFSAMLPIGLALLSEMTPRAHRASFMSIALVCFSGGNLASGAMTAWLLDIYGWQIGFLLGGVLPLAALPLLLLVPESLAFRVARSGNDKRIGAALRKIDPDVDLPGAATYHLGQATEVHNAGPAAMFGPRYRLQTAILWATCFLALGNIALLANWLPTYMQELGGIPVQQFAKYMMIAFAGGAAGTLSMGWLLDRTNPYLLIAGFFLIDAVALGSLGFIPAGTILFIGALVLWNYCQIGGQTGINTLATLGYPPEMRSSGIGWAGGAGRIGGIAFPYAGGLALAIVMPLDLIMLITAVPALIIAVLILLLGRVVPAAEFRRARSR